MLSSDMNGTKIGTLNIEHIFMMSGNIPNPQPQEVSYRLGVNLKVVNYCLEGNLRVIFYQFKL